ncbi:PfkB family carbohydrate kinase [Mesorhizobium australicum]|uniref:PfkB family carbohydrate kinase n=1 Tax=Mesorhizobium australicum TaxID=536018 RepID=UPI0033359670
MDRPTVVVVGSLHYDVMVDAPDRPRKGETVTGYSWRPKFGGKGGNQAIAAAKAGANTKFAGAVGDDEFGRFLLAALAGGGVDTSKVARVTDSGSGMSVAISDDGGDYGAVIVSGANLKVDPTAMAVPELWQDARVLILQNEMPEPINIAAARSAKAAGAIVCVNAAPYRLMSQDFSSLIDVLVVNSIEAEELCGVQVTDLASAALAADSLSALFKTVIVTAGGEGVVGLERGSDPISLRALPVKLISTHGAGDVFVGTLAAALASNQPFSGCISAANKAAALHVSTPARMTTSREISLTSQQ